MVHPQSRFNVTDLFLFVLLYCFTRCQNENFYPSCHLKSQVLEVFFFYILLDVRVSEKNYGEHMLCYGLFCAFPALRLPSHMNHNIVNM